MSDHDHDHYHHHHGRGAWGWVKEWLGFGHHDHSSGHRVDRALASNEDGIRAVKISLVGLGFTAALQLVIVFMSGSVALLSDTLHNFGDALTAVPLWIAFSLSRRAPTRRYTYGYGRSEDIAGIFIVVAIATSAGIAGYETIRRLLDPQKVDHLGLVIGASIIGFIGNELVAHYRITVGRRIGSAALVADGLHARTDGLTSLAVLAGALGVAAGYDIADPIAGLAITLGILVILRGAARDIYLRLMDAVDPTLVDQVEEVVRAAPGVRDVGAVSVRWIGHQLRAEVNITVDGSLTAIEAHDIAEEAHHALLHGVPRLSHATVHADPDSDAMRDRHQAISHHFPTQKTG